MKKSKVRVLSPFAAVAINVIINILEKNLVDRIQIEDIKNDIKIRLLPIRNMVKVLSDKDPNNAEQVKQVWLDFLKSEEFSDSIENRILQAIGLIDDDKTRTFISHLVVPVLQTVKALTDDNPNNVEQIRQAWTDYLTAEDTISSIVSFLILDESVHEDVVDIVQSSLEGLGEIIRAAITG